MFALEQLTVDLEPLREEIWLKFSKSQQQWTLYEFAYFRATNVDQEALRGAGARLSTVWLPLVGPKFAEAVRTERFEGVPIVDNIVGLLRNPAFVAEITQAV
jgi:hypothetical protein